MEWMKAIGDSIFFIEKNLLERLTVEKIAKSVNLSPYYFQKAFTIMCGYTVSEYIRNRRLALAGVEIVSTDNKIIDIAYKYGYDSPDSFTKAFTRFHGNTPSSVRSGATIKAFAPLKVKITLEGGNPMDYKIERKEAFKVIANESTFSYENAKEEVPKFWQEHMSTGKNNIVCGEFGISIDKKMSGEEFDYLIADLYKGQEVPNGFVVKEIPSYEWAVFPCRGPMPVVLQDTMTRIFTEWLPSIEDYELATGCSIEKYDDITKYPKGLLDENYYCEAWVAIKKK